MLTSAFSGPRKACALLLLDSFCSKHKNRHNVTSNISPTDTQHTATHLVDVVNHSGNMFKCINEAIVPSQRSLRVTKQNMSKQ